MPLVARLCAGTNTASVSQLGLNAFGSLRSLIPASPSWAGNETRWLPSVWEKAGAVGIHNNNREQDWTGFTPKFILHIVANASCGC